jgi:hypothetical protein
MIEIILFILVTICIVIMIISYIKIDISKHNIESEKIVDGQMLFYSSNSLTEWNSPLTSLQNGR